MTSRRRVVFVCCDGLGREWVTRAATPFLHDLAGRGMWHAAHGAVFPSVTRVSAASIATGCHPARHGLHGNRMGLPENGRIVVHDVGRPDFRSLMREATGRTLRVPTMAERVAGSGGFVAFSNVSPGAAYFLDPDCHGHVYHRAGSYAPGGARIEGDDALEVSHDLSGDIAMTDRFCADILVGRRPAVALLWLANPDHTLHAVPIGSPAHREALSGAERCVAMVCETVRRLRADGEDILLAVGSDHGHETIGNSVDLEGWLAAHGVGGYLQSGDVAVAGQGTSALLYATERGRPALLATLDEMRGQPWVAGVIVQEGLVERGHAAADGVVAAVNMACTDRDNGYGVRGQRWVVEEGGKSPVVGAGQHGGWGADETSPFLVIDHPAWGARNVTRATCLVDIAPTLMEFLGLPTDGFDGRPLAVNP